MSSDPLADDMNNNMSPAAASVFSSPPLSSSSNLIPATSTGQGSSYLSRAFNSNVTVVMAIILFALVVVAFINTVARCRRNMMHRGIWTRQQESRGVAGTTVLESAQQQQQQQQPWQLQHKGLQKVQIESFPVFTYGAATASSSKLQIDIECRGGGGLVIGTSRDDCAVCLSEYQNGEQVRLLPLCRHSFHLHCIDTWLSTHETCPVCRHSVLDHPHHHYPQSSMISDPAAAEAPDSSAAAAGSSLQDDGTADAASASTAEHTAIRGGAISGGFGSNILFNFGSARFGGSARISSTSDQIEPVVDLEDLHLGTPGSWTNDDQDVAAAAAAAAAAGSGSTSNSYQSSSAAASRWSFSAILLRNPLATRSG